MLTQHAATAGAQGSGPGADDGGEAAIAVRGSYGTKVCVMRRAPCGLSFCHLAPWFRTSSACLCVTLPQLESVVRRVAWLTGQDASTKLLIFSSWKDVLELVSGGR